MTKFLSIIAAIFGAFLYLLGRRSVKEEVQVTETKKAKEVSNVRQEARLLSDDSVDDQLQQFTRD